MANLVCPHDCHENQHTFESTTNTLSTVHVSNHDMCPTGQKRPCLWTNLSPDGLHLSQLLLAKECFPLEWWLSMPFNTQSSVQEQNTGSVPTQHPHTDLVQLILYHSHPACPPLANRVQKSNQRPAFTNFNHLFRKQCGCPWWKSGVQPRLNFLIMRISMKEMLIGASWPPRPPPPQMSVCHRRLFWKLKHTMEVLELKHGLGVRLVIFGLTSSDTKTSLAHKGSLIICNL